MFHVIPKRVILQNAVRISLRTFSQQQSPAGSSQKPINTEVPGLSENCVQIAKGRKSNMPERLKVLLNNTIGPNAAKDKEYKNPEYFSYHVDSFSEAEVEMAKFRLEAPSNKKPFNK